MTPPQRIQLRRTKGWRLQDVSLALNGLPAVRVTRPGKWGNLWSVRECAEEFDITENAAREMVVGWFRDWLSRPSDDEALGPLGAYGDTREHQKRLKNELETLRGKNLACSCKLSDCCHADVLLALANARPASVEVVEGDENG